MEKAEFYPGLVPPAGRQRLIHAIESGNGDPLAVAAQMLRLAQAASEDASPDRLRASVAASVLYDLVQQGWNVSTSGGRLYAVPPDVAASAEETSQEIKTRIREGLQRASNRQLAAAATQDFLRAMQRVRDHNGKPVSISTLIDDGDELADLLEAASDAPASDVKEKRLQELFQPRIQLCGPGDRCEHTGLSLLDVWRYFRHTWSLEYNSVPGRTLRVLVRNDGRPNSPVMGIAMIASPAANLYSRDEWIGWRIEDVARDLVAGKIDAVNIANVLTATVDEAIGDIRTDDLLSSSELKRPTEPVLFRLGQIAAKAEARRRVDLVEPEDDAEIRLVDIRSMDKGDLADSHWRKLSETALFTKKRAEQLIPLLQAKSYFDKADFQGSPRAALYEALVSRPGRLAVGVALNELRKRKLATQVADISVCGAAAPYNELLGGKLVALLMASDEIRTAYKARYEGQVSEIASQVAGRAIIRSADLKLITTTSLYGIGTSQYNRLRLPVYEDLGLTGPLVWRELRPSEGVTVTHLSKQTVDLMRRLGVAVYGRRRINSVFGEGSSPRTRQIREGLNLIGINHNRVLKHSVGRKVFACELYEGAIDDLTGFRQRSGAAQAPSAIPIAQSWARRWLIGRSANAEVLARLRLLGPASVAESLKERAIRGVLENPPSDEDSVVAEASREPFAA